MIKKIIKENYIYLIIILLLVTVLSIIMRSSLHDKIIIFDKKVFSLITNNLSNTIVSILKVLTHFGGFIIPCIILIIVLIFNNNRFVFLFQAGSYAIAGIITYVSKLIVARPRPEMALIKIPSSYSFPSGRTLTSIVFYITLCYLLSSKIKGIFRPIVLFITLLLVTLIALSRVYLGVHYFSDVIGGLILGIMCELLIINVVSRNFNDKI